MADFEEIVEDGVVFYIYGPIRLTRDWCKGCGICMERCPAQVLVESGDLNKRGIYPPEMREPEKCNKCKLCELLCPDFCLQINEDWEPETASIDKTEEE